MDRFAALVPCHLLLGLEQPPVDVVAQRLVPEAADVDPRNLGRAQHLHTRRQVNTDAVSGGGQDCTVQSECDLLLAQAVSENSFMKHAQYEYESYFVHIR